MPVSASIKQLDNYIELLRKDVHYLGNQRAAWAHDKATRVLEIIEVLRQVRQDKSMTGMDGKRLE